MAQAFVIILIIQQPPHGPQGHRNCFFANIHIFQKTTQLFRAGADTVVSGDTRHRPWLLWEMTEKACFPGRDTLEAAASKVVWNSQLRVFPVNSLFLLRITPKISL